MSGHSKWSTIKRQKGLADKKRGQIFTKLANAITFAVKSGSGITDPEKNFKLRLAIDKARSSNMPKDNINRAIKRATGANKEGSQIEEVVYEGFGPGGIAILVSVVTDNKNRTQSEIRMVFSRSGGNLAGSGSCMHLFDHVGIITFQKTKSLDDMYALALETEALDIEESKDAFILYTKPQELHRVKQLINDKVSIIDSVMGYRPKATISAQDRYESIIHLLAALDDLEDVHEVFTNGDF